MDHPIGRPFLLQELLVSPVKKGGVVDPFGPSPTMTAVILVGLSMDVGEVDRVIVGVSFPIVFLLAFLGDRTGLDGIVDSLRRAPEQLGNLPIGIAFCLISFNFMHFRWSQVCSFRGSVLSWA